MKIKLLKYTPDPERVIALSAKLCYSQVGVDELDEKISDEQVEKFINKLMSIGHESPIEHVNFTFAVEGISRVASHQLVRHRIASYSQQSQRYVKLDQFEYIIPPAIANNQFCNIVFIEAMESAQSSYDAMVEELTYSMCYNYLTVENDIFSEDCQQWSAYDMFLNMKAVNQRQFAKFEKKAIEDARFVFPNACETKVVFTMNARTLMNFFKHRCCNRAQWEIRDMANEMLKEVKKVAPTLFKYSGAPCAHGSCPEGNMGCGNPIRLEKGEEHVKNDL